MRGGSDTHRRGLLEELKGLFGPAFGPALEAYGRSFAERISEDEGFRAEIRDRFERGRAWGGFPELSSLLVGMSPEEEDEFFETGWTRVALPPAGPTEIPWDRAPWDGDKESYREGLYAGMAFSFTDLRAFAREWLEELLRVGYYGMEESTGLPLKQQADSLSPVPTESLPLYGDAYPVRFPSNHQTVWLELDGPRSEDGGYREIVVSEQPLRTDAAIVAAMNALEGRPLDIGLLREVLPDILPLRGESVYDRWTKAPAEHRKEALPEALGKLRHHGTLDYVLMLLRYHRSGFDDLPREERAALIADACSHLNDSLEVQRRFMAFIEYGRPGRGPVPAARSIARDVRAAVLKDVDGLTHRRIGGRLGVPAPADVGIKGDYPAVRKMVGRGRKFLKLALGDEGWRGQIQAMQAEANRRSHLTDTDRQAEDVSEALDIPLDKALELINDESTPDQPRKDEADTA